MNRIEVYYAGLKVGTIADANGGLLFQYDPGFIAAGHELSPLRMPLNSKVYSRGAPPSKLLHGLFEDSLPGQWGELLMAAWFMRRNVNWFDVTSLMQLAYVGDHGMGALSYKPAMDAIPEGHAISLSELSEAATQTAQAELVDLDALAEVGSSAGGAHPKAFLGLPIATSGDILSGAGSVPSTHEAWMIKFDVTREGIAGTMEHAYALMARAAGIDIPSTRLLETQHEGKIRRHFAVKRFDRDGEQRIHHHSLASMCHAMGADLDYTTFLRVTRQVTKNENEVWRAYRRAVFNVLASNRDDHGRNQGYLYRNRQWTLSPAFDLTFRATRSLPERGMAICGERSMAGRGHLLKLAEIEALDQKTALRVIDDVAAAIFRWREFAEEAQVPSRFATEIDIALNMLLKA